MKSILLSLLTGIVGFVIAFSAWHLYLDHRDFHALLNYVAQSAAAAKH